MYTGFLHLHSVLRYVVLILGLIAIVQAAMGASKNAPYTPLQGRIRTFFVIGIHSQLIIGLALYFGLSPVVKTAMADMGAAMKDSALRFWAVEHFVLMVLAVIMITIGSAMVRRAQNDAKKHKLTLLFFGVAFIDMMLAIPWPFRESLGRGWFSF